MGRIEAEDWLSRGNTTSPLTNKTLTSTQLIPNVTLRQSIEEFHNTKAKKKNENENKNEDQNDNDDMEMQTTSIPIQIQLDYEDSGSVTKHIRMFTLLREVSFSRKQAENGIDARIVAISTIHSAAELAQTGEYDAARIVLLSTQRLLQRSMKISNQKDYMAFIVLAEKFNTNNTLKSEIVCCGHSLLMNRKEVKRKKKKNKNKKRRKLLKPASLDAKFKKNVQKNDTKKKKRKKRN